MIQKVSCLKIEKKNKWRKMKKSYLPHVSQQNSKWFEWKVQEMILAKLKIIWMSDDPTVVDLLHTYYLSAPSLSPSLKLHCITMTANFTENDHFFKPEQIDWKRLICSAFNQNGQVWKKLSFWMKIVIILRISPLSIRVSYFVSTWDKSSDSWANSQKLTQM